MPKHTFSSSFALLAATSLSVLPVLTPVARADMQPATFVLTSTDATTTATETTPEPTIEVSVIDDTGMTDGDDTSKATVRVLTPEEITNILRDLTSNDLETLQRSYNELRAFIEEQQSLLETMIEGEERDALASRLADYQAYVTAFNRLLEGYSNVNEARVISTETITNPDGSTTTTTTYDDGSTTTVNTPATNSGYGGYGNDTGGEEDGGSEDGGIGEFLQKLMESPIVQQLISSMLQQLMNGGLGNLGSMLSNLGSAVPGAGNLMNGLDCPGGNCRDADIGTPNPTGTGPTSGMGSAVGAAVGAITGAAGSSGGNSSRAGSAPTPRPSPTPAPVKTHDDGSRYSDI